MQPTLLSPSQREAQYDHMCLPYWIRERGALGPWALAGGPRLGFGGGGSSLAPP
jgi:hypothetical protein